MQGLIEKAVRDVLLGSENACQTVCGTKHKIVVCQRGFVYAGDVEFCGDYIVIKNAVNIRRWGTSKGLGELAINGVTDKTQLDACGTVRVHQLAVVSLLDCISRIAKS